ncbi:Hypothetical predicted protein [Marmota monax]|uniref:Uncharacterized protein n=1 Tax=Marmota monax TaxID=9995 RepID=A0A5E4C5U9_MARMO|nr:hypothetical protein GHT09_019148 [Marmota monax]VTJ77303.1 Hypothetical predicted protein [Marmota monax]
MGGRPQTLTATPESRRAGPPPPGSRSAARTSVPAPVPAAAREPATLSGRSLSPCPPHRSVEVSSSAVGGGRFKPGGRARA